MRVVIKIGGAALDDRKVLHRCARAAADLVDQGHWVALVHGGGAALSRTLARLGKKSDFMGGLRVTDAETRDVAVMVLAGGVNKSLVAMLNAIDQPAVGLCGGDGASFRARKKEFQGVDLGFVGEICSAEPRWIEAVWKAGAIPVISSVALGPGGELYNVNADEMASVCAVACQADALIFLTDVPGVMSADGTVIRCLSLAAAHTLEGSQALSGGMLPKLWACGQALHRGVGRLCILAAAQADLLAQSRAMKIEVGTEVALA